MDSLKLVSEFQLLVQVVKSSIWSLLKLLFFLVRVFFVCCFSDVVDVALLDDRGWLFFFFLLKPDERGAVLISGSSSLVLSSELLLPEVLSKSSHEFALELSQESLHLSATFLSLN